MTKQSRSTWQNHERSVASALGVKRAGVAGVPGADVSTADWVIECKSWRSLPAKVLAALRQAERVKLFAQTAIAVIHQVGGRRGDDLVVMRWRDFQALCLSGSPADRRVAALVENSDMSEDERRILAPDS